MFYTSFTGMSWLIVPPTDHRPPPVQRMLLKSTWLWRCRSTRIIANSDLYISMGEWRAVLARRELNIHSKGHSFKAPFIVFMCIDLMFFLARFRSWAEFDLSLAHHDKNDGIHQRSTCL